MERRSLIGLCIFAIVVGSLWSYGTSQRLGQAPISPALVVAQPMPPPISSVPSTSQAVTSSVPPTLTVVRPPPAPAKSSPGSLAYLDFTAGFRHLNFNDPPTKDMRLIEGDGDTKYYKRPGDDLVIGKVNVREITYGFYKKRLDSVLLETKGLINSRAMLEVLREAYGSGYRPNQFRDRYVWNGSRMLLYYNEKTISNDAIVIFQDIPLRTEKAVDEKAKAQKWVSGS